MTGDGSYPRIGTRRPAAGRADTATGGPAGGVAGAPAPRKAVDAGPHAAGSPAGDQVRFGLWGASGGGKTTYLAALRIAAELSGWRMRGVTAADSDFLQEKWQVLYEQQTFPQPTIGGASRHRWMLSGDVPGRRRFGRGRAAEHVEFMLEFQDVPGAAYRLGHEATEDMLAHFMQCDGLVYLFDPVLDHAATRDGHNLGYFQGVVERLERQLGDENRLANGRLPHHLAVCVSKFDHPAVFHRAQEQGWINVDGDDPMPRVTDEQAEAFFREFICGDLGSRSARLLRTFIDNHFVPERVSYFVMSSIGFYLKGGAFDELDFSNIVREDGVDRIRDDIRPINVIEPLVLLHRRLRGARW